MPPTHDGSSPDRKRQRRTPPPMEQTPSMGSGPGYPHPSQQGMPGGPQAMVNGNIMRPGSMQGAPMGNFPPHNTPPNMGNPGMSLSMGAAMSPGMAQGPGNSMMTVGRQFSCTSRLFLKYSKATAVPTKYDCDDEKLISCGRCL